MKRFSHNPTILVARLLFAACVIGVTVRVILWVLPLTEPPSLFETYQMIFWTVILTIVFSFLGMLIITRQPGNRVGWFMMLIGLATLNPTAVILESMAGPPERLTVGLWLTIWLDSWSWVPVIFPIFLIPLHFPTGRPSSPRWNWVNRLALGMWLFFIIFAALGYEIGPLEGNWVTRNPIGLYSFEHLNRPFMVIWTAGLFTVLAASVVSLFIRYRRASSTTRQQIKWLMYAGLFFMFVYFVTAGSGGLDSIGWLDIVFMLSILAIPTAIAVAILRYQLYDIDIIIRRTLVYSLLTALLGLVYFGSVALLQNFVTADGRLQIAAGGQPSAVVIVVTTLVIAALFNPLRRRIQDFIDRRFYRQKYDGEKALGEFASAARSQTDLAQLSNSLTAAVQETLQPEKVNLWLRQ